MIDSEIDFIQRIDEERHLREALELEYERPGEREAVAEGHHYDMILEARLEDQAEAMGRQPAATRCL